MQDPETETQPRNILSSHPHWTAQTQSIVNTTMAFHAARLVRKRKSVGFLNNLYGLYGLYVMLCMLSNKVTEDQVEELMKAFAQADKVSNFIKIN